MAEHYPEKKQGERIACLRIGVPCTKKMQNHRRCPAMALSRRTCYTSCCSPATQHGAEEAATDCRGCRGSKWLAGRPEAGRAEASAVGQPRRDEMRSRRSDHKRCLRPFWTAFRSPRCGDGFRSCGDLEQGLDVGFGSGFGGFFDSVCKKQSGAMQRRIWRGGLRGERGRRCTGSEASALALASGCKRAAVLRVPCCSRAIHGAPAPFSLLYSLPSS
jgi:hypothetical protein